MYKIVYYEKSTLYDAINYIENEVKKLKSEGYTEQGGISLSVDTDRYWFTVAQAMVKKNNKTKKLLTQLFLISIFPNFFTR